MNDVTKDLLEALKAAQAYVCGPTAWTQEQEDTLVEAMSKAIARAEAALAEPQPDALRHTCHSAPAKFRRGDLVRKVGGAAWQGRVVGEYSTDLTAEGYAVESEVHRGSVQIYPAKALELLQPLPAPPES